MQALEEYIANMENRSAIDAAQAAGEDVWTQLRQKENDLQLAAELGKALLEKNEELKKQHDAAVEEYSRRLEVTQTNPSVSLRCLPGVPDSRRFLK